MSAKRKSIFEKAADLAQSVPNVPEKPIHMDPALISRLFLDQLAMLQQVIELARIPNPALLPQLLAQQRPPQPSDARSPAFPNIAPAPNSNGTVLVLSQPEVSPPTPLPPNPPTKKQDNDSKRPQPPRFQCPDCSRSYSTFSGLSKHRQFHCSSQLQRQFACKYCDKEYSSLGALKMHIRTHTLPCKCGICGKAFSRPWLLQGHLRTHTGEKPFTCGHCSRAFADRSNLRAHLQTHSHVKKYRCSLCVKTFSRISLLHKHQNNGCPANSSRPLPSAV